MNEQAMKSSPAFTTNDGLSPPVQSSVKIMAPTHSPVAAKNAAGSSCSPEDDIPNSARKSTSRQFIDESLWPGMGLLGESYMLFSVGTLKPIWNILFPDTERVQAPLTYSVVLGVIFGMLLLGYLASQIGRRRGSIATASLMCTGATGLTAASIVLAPLYPKALFRFMTVFLFVFGVGVGGEYPLAAASASEKAMGELQSRLLQQQQEDNNGDDLEGDGLLSAVVEEEDSKDVSVVVSKQVSTVSAKKPMVQGGRGRHIQMVFCMQGVGIFLNCLIMTALFVITGQGKVIIARQQGEENKEDGNDNINSSHEASLLAIWRITYALGSAILMSVLYYRIRFLKESKVWENDRQRRQGLVRNALNNSSNSNQKASPSQLPEILESASTVSGISMVSTVSSLSAPSVVARHLEDHDDDDGDQACDFYALEQVPSTDPADDLRESSWCLMWRNYGVRITGASLCWLLWDVSFYGNKLFQSTFILAMTGSETTLLQFAIAATLNSGVALMGYIGAAMLVDHVGRRRLQQWGFLLTGGLFVSCGFLYESLSVATLVAMYLGTSFFGQLGPNATTFLIPAEIFPTEVRTFCHGVAAASGKVGALLAAVAFNYVGELDMFLLSGYASFAACIVTFWTIPETLGLDLYEIDRKWRMTLDGRKGEYQGDANHPRFLSYYERNKLSQKHQQQNDPLHHDHFHSMD